MKVYISGKITGTKDYMLRFTKAEHHLYQKYGDIPVINPAKVNSMLPAEDTSYEEYMKMCFCMLDMCDAIYMMPGWRDSNGAKREFEYAQARGMTILGLEP